MDDNKFMKANCCKDLDEVVGWFTDLKKRGVTKEEILDVLEFESDQYPDMETLLKAKEQVYGK